VAYVVLGTGKPLELGAQLFGDLLMIVATIIWALNTVLSYRLLKRYSAIKLNALTMPIGSALIFLAAAPSLPSSAPMLTGVPPLVWLVLVVSGLLALSFAYIAWNEGLQKLGATRTAVYANLVPVIAAFVAFVFLSEPLGWQFWVGMTLALAGVSLARFSDRLLGLLRRPRNARSES
jgi:drug/metabolite transporter (DMT)-like permease